MKLTQTQIKAVAGNNYLAWIKKDTLADTYRAAGPAAGVTIEIIEKAVVKIRANAGEVSHDGLALNVACYAFYPGVKLPISRKFFLTQVAKDITR